EAKPVKKLDRVGQLLPRLGQERRAAAGAVCQRDTVDAGAQQAWDIVGMLYVERYRGREQRYLHAEAVKLDGHDRLETGVVQGSLRCGADDLLRERQVCREHARTAAQRAAVALGERDEARAGLCQRGGQAFEVYLREWCAAHSTGDAVAGEAQKQHPLDGWQLVAALI